MPQANLVIRQLGPLVQAFSRVKEAMYVPPRSTIEGLNETLWPNPLQPVQPIGPPGAEPLSIPFHYGQNLLFTPRADAEYTAEELRRYSQYLMARVCIENNKDMITRIPFRVQVKPLPGETSESRSLRSSKDETIKKLNKFFEHPNSYQDWAQWLRPVLEDMYVIDAASVFLARTRKGEIAELHWVDGASIVRLVDEHGWTPHPPNPAYQQLWQGYPRVDLTTQQLVYRPRNIVPRSNVIASFLYGYSPTEQCVPEIKVGIERLQFVYDFYKEGSIPGGMLFAPVGTPTDKIQEAQQLLDSGLAGRLDRRRRLQILQGFQTEGKKEQVVFPQEPSLADVFDELHIRKICFAYGTSPQRLMRMVNRASAQAMQETSEKEGLLPWLNWVKSVMDHIIQVQMGFTDYDFNFDPFMELDKLKKAMADSEDVKIGLYTRNEKRKARGDDPRPEPEADKLMIMTGSGAIALGETTTKKSEGEGAGFGRVPDGGAQPRASAQARTTEESTVSAGSKVAKANGAGESE